MPCASAVPGGSTRLAVGIAEAGAALGAAHHRAGHAPPVAEHLAAPATSPCASSARTALEENTSPASATWATTVTPKPCAAPARRSVSGSPRTALAEAEVVADHHMAHAQPLHQHAVDEGLRRQPGQGGVEAHHHRHIEPERLQQRQLARQRRQAEMRLVRLEELARMRLEHDGAGRPAAAAAPRRWPPRSAPGGRGARRRSCRSPARRRGPRQERHRYRGQRSWWSGSSDAWHAADRFRLPHVASEGALWLDACDSARVLLA